MDPYVLSILSLIDSQDSSPDLKINNLVFMDDSTLISSSKVGMKSMLSITEEFYQINNTSANHNKYVLITNSFPLSSSSTLSPITFNLELFSLNSIPSIAITPISMTTSFRFLGVWFNIKNSRDFVKKQLKRECYSFVVTIRPAKLSPKQVVYLHNAILILKLEYRMQVTHLSESDCHLITRSIRSVVKHKANFSCSLPNPILFLSQALVGTLSFFSPTTKNWIVSLNDFGSPIFGKQLLVQAGCGTCFIVHWVSSNCESSPGELIKLSSCPGCAAHIPLPPSKKRNADLTLCTPTVSLQHSLILPTTNERIRRNTSEVTSPFTWADIEDGVRLYYSRLDFASDSPPADTTVASATHITIESSAAAIFANSPLVAFVESRYIFFTDGSLINLGYYRTNYPFQKLTVLPIKVKAHSGNYLNDFADSLANTAHTASSSILISGMDLASAHDFVITYDNDVVCESNLRLLLKQYYQMQLMRDLLHLMRFHFTSLLSSNIDYVVDWDYTWFALKFEPSHDVSFTFDHASRHRTFKFKLFLDELPILEKLKRTRPDLYIDVLTCRFCIDRIEDLMHLFMCKKHRLPMQQILQSYQNHLISKIQKVGELADIDPTPFITKLTSLSCWSFSSTNWSSYALVRNCLPKLFIDLFVDLSILRNSAMKVISAIHNNFVQKFRRRIWNLRSYEKSRWEDAMNITYKLKTTPRPSNLPLSMYILYSSLPPPTLHDSRDSRTNWLKNSMKYGLPWFNHFSGFMGHLTAIFLF
ncbi:hypothetical protein RhiirB3_394680 [Rhizophagus irregularis]|nr:hypothetical protein RhiirB3_394680 [Rhizophagus irregularis]